ncbi:MAG: HAD family phosphatase [Bacteroidales bacterium]|nr:HAD family phosphatase [Bacteroidales bacterium]
MYEIELVATDLDGTLLNRDKTVSADDFSTLNSLVGKNIYRVIATGRTLYSLRKIITDDFPVDYIIFSSGAGIINWKTKELIYTKILKKKHVLSVCDVFFENNVDFTIHKKIPKNHRFVFNKSSKRNNDFDNYCNFYKEFAEPLNQRRLNFSQSTQLLAIFPNNIEMFNKVKEQLSDVKVIRATSPVDEDSIWMEIFPENVSKGNALLWLCKKLAVDIKKTIGIGNDYNDEDFLNVTNYSFVVDNAPEEIKQKFSVTDSNKNSGFTKAVEKILNSSL